MKSSVWISRTDARESGNISPTQHPPAAGRRWRIAETPEAVVGAPMQMDIPKFATPEMEEVL